jgi:hypothetical protein
MTIFVKAAHVHGLFEKLSAGFANQSCGNHQQCYSIKEMHVRSVIADIICLVIRFENF